MRIFLKGLLIALCLVILPLSGAFATGEQPVINLDEISATFELPKNFVTSLTPESLDANEAWFTATQKDRSEVEKDFEDRSVLFQAWNDENNICLEITGVKDEWANTYFDMEAQTAQIRSEYRAAHLNDEINPNYSFDEAEWQQNKSIGRFLMLKYVHRFGNDVTHRGFARRTIRNGYTITVDLKVFSRTLKASDNNILNKVMESWRFTQIHPLPIESAAKSIYYTQEPPKETNTGSFKVKGVADPEATVIGVLMSWTRDQEPLLIETTANKKGEFTLEIDLPAESTYGMSLTVKTQNATYEELLIRSILYNKGQIPVSFIGDFAQAAQSSDLHLVTNEDKVVLEGTSMKGAKIQLVYNGKNIKKNVGGNQSFSFNIPTKEEGSFEATISFNTATHSERRFNFTVERKFTPSQQRAKIKEEAVKPAYGTLTDKLDGYTGRYMVYTLYPLSFEQVENDQWLIKMAMRSTKSGFKEIVYVQSSEEPGFTLETELRLYLECLGAYPIDTGEIIPYFKWLFAE